LLLICTNGELHKEINAYVAAMDYEPLQVVPSDQTCGYVLLYSANDSAVTWSRLRDLVMKAKNLLFYVRHLLQCIDKFRKCQFNSVVSKDTITLQSFSLCGTVIHPIVFAFLT